MGVSMTCLFYAGPLGKPPSSVLRTEEAVGSLCLSDFMQVPLKTTAL